MKKLYDKDEVLFAVCWIIIYVVGFGNADSISIAIGFPKVITAALGIVLSTVLYAFIRRHRLLRYYGLCPVLCSPRRLLYFIPLVIISSTNLWRGLTLNESLPVSVLSVISMCCVGFLEEVIFRGLLFKGMCKSSVKTAILVSSLTFGAGHIVNLLLGAPLLDTLLQLVYASAMGLCFTAIFMTGGSILPCILSHALVNSLSIFAVEPDNTTRILSAVLLTALSLLYGLWLLRGLQKDSTSFTKQ